MNTRPSDLIIAESPMPRYNTPLRIDESILCLGDLQIPYHDANFISQCVKVAKSFGVTACGWFGDAFDMHALSIFLAKQTKDLENELDFDESFGTQLASQFDKVYWIRGNHDARMAMALMQWLPTERIKKLIGLGDNVVTSDYFWSEIGTDWIASHPKNSSVIPGRIPSTLSAKYRKNVLAFHGHLVSASMFNGLWAIDVGMCADPEKLEYVCLRQSTRPAPQRGAALMLRNADGSFTHRTLSDATNWDLEMKAGEMWQKESRASDRRMRSQNRYYKSATTRTRKRARK